MSPRSDSKARLKIALTLASEGLRILPIYPGAKDPTIKRWVTRATTDEAQIEQWFEEFPNMNYGIVGGSKSGLFILDCDVYKESAPKDGWLLSAAETYRLMVKDYGLDLDGTFTVRTPSGGIHHYFEWPEGIEDEFFVGHSVSHRNLGLGMDFEASGGMVLGPGSVIDGKTYAAVDLEAPFARLPQGLIDDLKKQAPLRSTERSKVTITKKPTAASSRSSAQPGMTQDDVINPRWVETAIHGPDGIVNRLQNLSPEEGSRDNDCWNGACQLAGFANTPGSGLTEAKAFDLYISGTAHLVGGDFTQETIEEKWSRALVAADPVKIPAPVGRPQNPKSVPEEELKGLYRDGALITQFVAEYIVKRWNIQMDESNALYFYDAHQFIFRPFSSATDDLAGGARADIARILLNDNSFSVRRVNNIIDAIQITKHVLPRIDTDRSGQYIPFRNGVLERRTREFLPHSPERSSTFLWKIDYDPDAECPMNDRQVELTMAPDAHDYYWEFMASVLFPSKASSTQKAWILYGTGNEGKSTCLETVRSMLGGDNSVAAITLHDLNPSKVFRVAELRGKRANIVDDVSKLPIRDSAILKSLIFGELVYGERKFEQGKTFRFTGSMAFGTNHVFNAPEGGEAWFRRFMYIHFPNKMESDPTFDEGALRTSGELSGIFNKALEAADRIADKGFDVPESAKRIERMFQNPGQSWLINEWLESSEGNLVIQATGDREQVRITTGDAWKAFKTWAASRGIHDEELPQRNKAFHPYMRLRFTEKTFAKGGRHYIGLALSRKLRAVDDEGRKKSDKKKSERKVNPRTGEVLNIDRKRAIG